MANAYYKNGSSWINMANVFYPVGAYYLANTSTSPSSLFGGTWTNLTGRFLYCNNGTSTNGSNKHTLTTNEMPSHTHTISYTVIDWTAGGYHLSTAGTKQSTGYTTIKNTSTSAGGSSAHNNMPAYKTCYCWYRTA